MPLQTPETLRTEHRELHEQLSLAIDARGRTGAAAQAVARLLHPHFVKEEEFALPPLGLLAELAQGRFPGHATSVLPLTDKLEAELPAMLAEHEAIVAALQELEAAATAEKKPQHAHFAEKLIAHARMEEDVMYPAAILVGKWIRPLSGAQRAGAAAAE